MRYCVMCLQPDTRPNIRFSKKGICPACDYHRSLVRVDWQKRFDILKEIVQKCKHTSTYSYDCILGVSGGKDSTRQALFLKEKLKLNPLLVCMSNPPEQVSINGVQNISNLISLGFDLYDLSPAPATWRELVRQSFFKFSNWAKASELAIFSYVPRLAINLGIPLVFWGENPALQIGDLKTLGTSGFDGNNSRFGNTLASGHDWMLDLGFKSGEIYPYLYPSEQEFKKNKIRIIFLGWFLGNWSLMNNAKIAIFNGLKIRNQSPIETGDLYGVSNLDEDWHNMNQMIKYYKYGFGKTTEYVNEEIRSGVITRDDAITLVDKYDGRISHKYVESFSDYIGVTPEEFWLHVKDNINQKLFYLDKEKKITPKFKIGTNFEEY